ASQQHQAAQMALAQFYLRADAGKYQSQEKALALYEAMARNGDANVQLELFNFYQRTDAAKAVHWLTDAAQQGAARGQYGMGPMLFNGHLGVAKDYPKAGEWYLASAQQGHPLAMYEMGH